jgi:RimJ/RimL family protein N-acetyltransferase
MNWRHPILTERLILSPFSESDAEFFCELVNTPDWIKWIGDRHIHSTQDALQYLQNGPLKLWRDKGYGPFVACDRLTGHKMCYVGWVKRDHLDQPDLGYACLPPFYRQGYVHEACSELIKLAAEANEWPHIYAFTLPENTASVGVLEKLSFSKVDSFLEQPANEWVDLYKRML